jgi:hypothetical protein
MSENTMREAFEAWAKKYNRLKDTAINWLDEYTCYEKLKVHIAYEAWQAAIAHKNQEAVPIYQAANRGQWMDISLQSFITHTGITRELFLAPPQPQTVKDALEAAAKICDENSEDSHMKYELTKNSYYEGATDFLDKASQEIRALIK